MQTIRSREQLEQLATQLGVRNNWHEPDEQGLTTRLIAGHFDNAMGDASEDSVVLLKDGKQIAFINLATLFAYATGYDGPTANRTHGS